MFYDEKVTKLSNENLALVALKLKTIGTLKTLFQLDERIIVKFGTDFKIEKLNELQSFKINEKNNGQRIRY